MSADFVYLKIPRGRRERDALRLLAADVDGQLRAQGVGSVAGWGDSIGDDRADGGRPLAYTRIDVDVSRIEAARTLLHAALATLQVPAGTELHFCHAGQDSFDVYGESGWLLDQAMPASARRNDARRL
jgi:hypothetical protein